MQIFGIDLARKKIQAVWIMIENNSDRPVYLLSTSIDHDYFPPLEVAFVYHKPLATKMNAALDEHIVKLKFPNRSRIVPGSRASGYIFTNWSKGTKVIDIDLLGRDFSQNFTFFAHNPDNTEGQQVVERIENFFSTFDIQNVENEVELRRVLEQLPCCVSEKEDTHDGEPLNVVVIGELDDWLTAFTRRGYRYHLLNPRYAFGRVQDISGHKVIRGYNKAQAHTVRLWQTPIKYQSKTVWIGQTSTRWGWRFMDNAPPEETLPLDSSLDEARIDLTQDLVYSQALLKIGHVKGAGRPQVAKENNSAERIRYMTDGLRVVLVFGQRPTSLSEIDFFRWERLSDYR